MASYIVLEHLTAEIQRRIYGVDIVECLMLSIVGGAILVCQVEVYHLIELDAYTRGDKLLACGNLVASDKILPALTKGVTAPNIACTQCQEGQYITFDTCTHCATTLEDLLRDTLIVKVVFEVIQIAWSIV
jgi:hypothetical protein